MRKTRVKILRKAFTKILGGTKDWDLNKAAWRKFKRDWVRC